MTTHDKVVLFNVLCTFGAIPACYVLFYAYSWIMKK